MAQINRGTVPTSEKPETNNISQTASRIRKGFTDITKIEDIENRINGESQLQAKRWKDSTVLGSFRLFYSTFVSQTK